MNRGTRHQNRRRAGRRIMAAWLFFGACFLLTMTGFFVAMGRLDQEGVKEKGGTVVDKDSLTDEERNGNEPLFLQTDERWKNLSYGQSTISEAGCAPTCLAMVVVALTGNRDITPQQVAKYSETCGYYEAGQGTRWTLISEGSREYGLQAAELPLSESRMIQTLEEGGRIICAMRPGDFTTEGHFIELYWYDDEGFRVHDHNSLERSRRLWKYSELEWQIRNLWGLWY